MKTRIAKALASCGLGSRRHCESLIFNGKVIVNGVLCVNPAVSIDLKNDSVIVNGNKIEYRQEEKVVFLLHKPKGFLCSNLKTRKTDKLVIDIFSDAPSRLFTVGRLDKDTTGLLLVTNDGIFANRVIHPSFGIEKEYLAKVNEEIEDHHLKIISKGVEIEGKRIMPLRVIKVRRGTIKIVVVDGKKREVRFLLQEAGLSVYFLCRIRIGGLVLGQLPEGSYRLLSDKEKQLVLG